MSRDQRFREAIALASRAWREQGALGDFLSPIFALLLEELRAERALFLVVAAGGQYRVRSSRNVDGHAIADPERWISHFALTRALEQKAPCYFPETRQDRRFRTEAEIDVGMRARSILVAPVISGSEAAALYFNSRFQPIEWGAEEQALVDVFRNFVDVGLRMESSAHDKRALEKEVRILELKLESAAAANPPAPVARVAAASGEEQRLDFHGFVTAHPALLQAITSHRQIARSKIPIMIQGESGTGKEILARALHRESGRSGAFVSIHCGAMPRTLVEIELFGHARGAFTGADRERSGLIAAAEGGSLFFDELSEMPPEMQTALLRVLESGTFRRVSDTEERAVDARVISSTCAVTEGAEPVMNLRADLYYRLAGSILRIPPLRKRREDIPLLVEHFLAKHAPEKSAAAIFDDAAQSALVAYDWPGNVRELENVIRRCTSFRVERILLSHLNELTGGSFQPASQPTSEMQAILNHAEREALVRALERAGGNKSRACRLLGLSRKTLYRRLEKHGIGY